MLQAKSAFELRFLICAGLLLLTIAVSTCEKKSLLPADWPVSALTLPGDAKNIETSAENLFEFNIPGLGSDADVIATWTVEFTSRSGPDIVGQHIEECIERAGFVTELPNVPDVPHGVPLEEEVRTYFSPDGKYAVIFMSDLHLLGADGFAHTLIVSQFATGQAANQH